MDTEALKDIVFRAAKTYIQTAIGLVMASGVGIDNGGLSVWRAAALGGVPAALSVVQNGLKAWRA